MQAFLIYSCPLCGENEDVGPIEIPEPPTLLNVPSPGSILKEAIWHQCYKKAGLDLRMWGICKLVGVREVAPPKKENDEDSKSVGN
jgi:hypothetical protein